MNLTQFLIFESGRECNLGTAHDRCPNLHPERCKHCDTSAELPDERIVEVAAEAYGRHGFEGLVGFHYYNEPLAQRDRILRLTAAIRARVPDARFVLWTNGQLLPQEGPELDALSIFDKAWLTQYDGKNYKRILKAIPATKFLRWGLDQRAAPAVGKDRREPCGRMFSEFVFDFYGNAHICCIDWRGEVRLGNVQREPFAEILARFQHVRDQISRAQMDPEAPRVCRRCNCRHGNVSDLVEEVAERGKAYVAQLRKNTTQPPAKTVTSPFRSSASEVLLPKVASPRAPAVVFVSYRIPEERLRAHFAWNGAQYLARGVRVFVVVDKVVPGLPGYVRQLVYRDRMDIFNLARTKNVGIRHAMESGCDPIICADVDVMFSDAALRLCLAVPSKSAVVPVYRMAHTFDQRQTLFDFAPKATGTVAMRAEHWRAAHYHEECEGYGCDDGVLLSAIQKQGCQVDRVDGAELWHIAHKEGTPQKEFNKAAPRVDHWNRSEGFNPENFAGNRPLYRAPIFKEWLWGLQSTPAPIVFVAVHYRIPDARLLDFISWNREQFERVGARLIIVDDVPHTNLALPEWARVAVFPKPLDVFNLAATSNYGIRLAGDGIVCKTDIDCVFPREAVDAVASVTDAAGVCFLYRMARSVKPEDLAAADPWDASKGTLALTASHWHAISGYDERMEGYGIEDGDAFHRAAHSVPGRTCAHVPSFIWHIAHSAAPQPSNVRGRSDLWNGAEFNPKNHRQNQTARHTAWASAAWGNP